MRQSRYGLVIVGVATIGLLLGAGWPATAADSELDLVGRPVSWDENGHWYVYSDAQSRSKNFVPSGWMGDHGDLKLNDKYREKPYAGDTAIQWTYSAAGRQGANWAGCFWQNPANNWGDVNGGFDLSQARRLTFWARGEQGGERLLEVKVGGITGTYSDTDSVGIGPLDLTAEWQQFEIDLSDADLSYISGGFCWATNADANPDGMVFYFDEIRFER